MDKIQDWKSKNIESVEDYLQMKQNWSPLNKTNLSVSMRKSVGNNDQSVGNFSDYFDIKALSRRGSFKVNDVQDLFDPIKSQTFEGDTSILNYQNQMKFDFNNYSINSQSKQNDRRNLDQNQNYQIQEQKAYNQNPNNQNKIEQKNQYPNSDFNNQQNSHFNNNYQQFQYQYQQQNQNKNQPMQQRQINQFDIQKCNPGTKNLIMDVEQLINRAKKTQFNSYKEFQLNQNFSKQSQFNQPVQQIGKAPQVIDLMVHNNKIPSRPDKKSDYLDNNKIREYLKTLNLPSDKDENSKNIQDQPKMDQKYQKENQLFEKNSIEKLNQLNDALDQSNLVLKQSLENLQQKKSQQEAFENTYNSQIQQKSYKEIKEQEQNSVKRLQNLNDVMKSSNLILLQSIENLQQEQNDFHEIQNDCYLHNVQQFELQDEEQSNQDIKDSPQKKMTLSQINQEDIEESKLPIKQYNTIMMNKFLNSKERIFKQPVFDQDNQQMNLLQLSNESQIDQVNNESEVRDFQDVLQNSEENLNNFMNQYQQIPLQKFKEQQNNPNEQDNQQYDLVKSTYISQLKPLMQQFKIRPNCIIGKSDFECFSESLIDFEKFNLLSRMAKIEICGLEWNRIQNNIQKIIGQILEKTRGHMDQKTKNILEALFLIQLQMQKFNQLYNNYEQSQDDNDLQTISRYIAEYPSLLKLIKHLQIVQKEMNKLIEKKNYSNQKLENNLNSFQINSQINRIQMQQNESVNNCRSSVKKNIFGDVTYQKESNLKNILQSLDNNIIQRQFINEEKEFFDIAIKLKLQLPQNHPARKTQIPDLYQKSVKQQISSKFYKKYIKEYYDTLEDD